jgi:hypothetical protein
MPPPSQTQPTTAVVLERIQNLQDDVRELYIKIDLLMAEQRAFNINYTKCHAELLADVKDHEKRLVEVERLAETLKDLVSPLVIANKILIFIGSSLMLMVIAFLWAILTHKVIL